MTYGRTMRVSSGRTAALAASFVPHWKQRLVRRKASRKNRTVGWFVGIDPETGLAVYINFHGDMASGDAASSDVLFTGFKGGGKSASMKIMTLTLSQQVAPDLSGTIRDFRVFIDNVKPDEESGEEGTVGEEWQKVVGFLGWSVVDVNAMSFEVFNSKADDNERLSDALDIAEMIREDKLPLDQQLAIMVAAHRHRQESGLPFTTPEFERTLSTLCDADIKAFNTALDNTRNQRLALLGNEALGITQDGRIRNDNHEMILAAAAGAAVYFQLILKGAFGQTFMGTQTLADHMQAPVTMFRFGPMTDKQKRLFELMRFHTLRTASRQGDISVIPHLWVREEIQHALGDPVVVRRWAEWSALARAYHTITFNSTQYITTLTLAMAKEGTATYLKQIFNGIDLFVLFRQPDDDETTDALSKLGLNETLIKISQSLPDGEDSYAIMKPRNGQAYLCQFVATYSLEKLIKTRGAANRMAEGSRGAIRARLEYVKEHEK